jgi:hypothetical protein
VHYDRSVLMMELTEEVDATTALGRTG